ncbi:MAG TPA: VCBS repeat-containing protein, partial [Chitinophagales bacterium]|nr:VCBS repeat-containing protein [Chitinophagales bacterium]
MRNTFPPFRPWLHLCCSLFVLLFWSTAALGQTSFAPAQIIEESIFTSAYFAEIDNDGSPDIVFSGGNVIGWFKNNNNGGFNAFTIIGFINAEITFYTIDIDNDGDNDLVSGYTDNLETTNLVWYENDGNGNFSLQVIDTNIHTPLNIYAIDIDNDGDNDVLSGSFVDAEVAWYENDGSGNFGTEQIIATDAIGVNDISSIDLDNDGDNDVLLTALGDASMVWYANNGDGNFGDEQIISTNTVRYSTFPIDFDNDGDIDIIGPSSTNMGVDLYENDGNANFNKVQIIEEYNFILSILWVADLDNDGDNDIISGGTYEF